jgi:hypothetical protein
MGSSHVQLCVLGNNLKSDDPFFNKDALIKYCDENNICLLNDYNNLKITRDTIIEGKCINGCINIFKKTFRYLKNYGGYCDICTISNKKIKSKNTCLQKYGVEHAFQSDVVKNKIKETCIQRYGCENAINNNSHIILPLSFSIMSLINPFGAALYKQLNVKILLFIGSIICIGSIYLAS